MFGYFYFSAVKSYGTEDRHTDRPVPPKEEIYEYIIFRGSDIKDITVSEPPKPQHGLPCDPAIVQVYGACEPSPIFNFIDVFFFPPQSSLSSSSAPYHPRWSPYRDTMPTYNQLAASSLLSQQYNAALGLGNACSRPRACLPPPLGSTVDQTPLPFSHLLSQHLGFTASRPDGLPWWSRLCRRCHRSAPPRGGATH